MGRKAGVFARQDASLIRYKLLEKGHVAVVERVNREIPIAPLRWSVARPGLLGHFANGRGWHLLQNLGRDTT